jgi:hypothetical protein
MKTRQLIVLSSLACLGIVGTGCSADIHDNNPNIHDNTVNIPNAMVTVKADTDVDNIMPEQTVPLNVMVQNVYLVAPTATPPPEHAADAGHIQIYLDDVATPPLVVTAEVKVEVKIPPQTKPGKHKLVCRVHKHDGTPTTTVYEVNITVKVTVGGVAPDAGAPADTAPAMTTPDASPPSTDATTPGAG